MSDMSDYTGTSEEERNDHDGYDYGQSSDDSIEGSDDGDREEASPLLIPRP